MKIMFRILSSVALIFSMAFVPWWLWVLLAVAALFFWKNYYEIIVIAFIFDVAVGLSYPGWYPFLYGSVILFVMIELLKRRLIVYPLHE